MRTHGGVFFLLCLLACLAAVGVVVFGLGSESAAAETAVLAPEAAAPDAKGLAVEAPVDPAAIGTSTGVFRPSERGAVVDAGVGTKRTYGLIRGDVTLTAGTIDKIESVTIRILEAVRDDAGTGTGRKPFIYHYSIPFDPRNGTPRFALDEIPFSAFGYLVQAMVPGLNGTEQLVYVTEDKPIADVVLGVHPGTPFSVLLRDQDLTPLGNVEVTLTPEGEPQGRGSYYKQTDSFGAAVFPDVLRGTYLAHLGNMAQPLMPPQPIEVLASSGLTAQSKTIVVPKGEAVTVNLYAPSGQGIKDVEVRLSSNSDTRYREIKVLSDWSGRAVFPHLPPGSYWVNVTDPRYEPRTVPALVRKGEKPKDVDVRLVMR
jgi:hypothetical protein